VPKGPCTRCQIIYSVWTLDEKPDTPENWIDRFDLDLKFGQIKYRQANPESPCSYCAETVAAAQLYALCHGVLTLVFPKDTDELKVSGKKQR